MLSDNASVLADYDAIGIGINLDRTPDRTGRHRVLIVVETKQVFETDAGTAWNPSNLPA